MHSNVQLLCLLLFFDAVVGVAIPINNCQQDLNILRECTTQKANIKLSATFAQKFNQLSSTNPVTSTSNNIHSLLIDANLTKNVW